MNSFVEKWLAYLIAFDATRTFFDWSIVRRQPWLTRIYILISLSYSSSFDIQPSLFVDYQVVIVPVEVPYPKYLFNQLWLLSRFWDVNYSQLIIEDRTHFRFWIPQNLCARKYLPQLRLGLRRDKIVFVLFDGLCLWSVCDLNTLSTRCLCPMWSLVYLKDLLEVAVVSNLFEFVF